MKKPEELLYGTTMEELNRNGKSSILMNQNQLQLKDTVKNSDSISTDHSTSDLDFHSEESWRCTETDMSISEDGSRAEQDNNGNSMEKPRLS